MREFLFKGKTVGEKVDFWVEGECRLYALGWFSQQDPQAVTIDTGRNLYLVDRDSVGQYTGRKDKNGRMIFEGDRLKYTYEDTYGTEELEMLVVWSDELCGFACEEEVNGQKVIRDMIDEEEATAFVEVIGNRFDEVNAA